MSDAMAGLRDQLRHEPTEKRIRAELGGRLVVDTTRAVLVWEPRRICPQYAVPAEDLWASLESDTAREAGAGVLHPGIPFAEHSTPGESFTLTANGETRAAAAFRPADPDLAGHVVLDFAAFDTWFEEDEPIRSHPRDPYHRVDMRAASRHVRIAYQGRLLADTTSPTLVYETSLPTRFYVPREDLVGDLTPSDTTTFCPYKGEATYFSIAGRRDAAWTYEHPLPDAAPLKDLVAFYDEVMDVTVDGTTRTHPDTPVTRALRAEFLTE
ncbi:DUF427 domain-containing protein [Virgisporangium aurantiacum]